MRYIFILLLFISCTATKEVQTPNYTYVLKGKEVKAFNKSEKAYNLNVQGSRVFSIYKFPAKSDTITKETFIKGDTIIKEGQTIFVNCDSIAESKGGKAGLVEHKCPDSKLIVDTFVKTVYVNIYDTKEVDAIANEANECKDDLIKEQRKTSTLTIWIVILSIALIISLLFNFKR